jgi:hypothetical protein
MSVDTFVKFNSVFLYTYAKSAALQKVAYFTNSCALTVANGVSKYKIIFPFVIGCQVNIIFIFDLSKF